MAHTFGMRLKTALMESRHGVADESSHGSQQALCLRCNSLRIDESLAKLAERPYPGTVELAKFEVQLLSDDGVLGFEKDCVLCSFARKILDVDGAGSTGQKHPWICTIEQHYYNEIRLNVSKVQLYGSHITMSLHDYQGILRSTQQVHAIGDLSLTESNNAVGLGRFVPREEADTKLLASWINICNTMHGDTCSTVSPQSFPGLRFIDVHERCLVDAPQQATYSALSYVWGASKRFGLSIDNLSELQQPGSLADTDESISLVVRDAIIATEKLGMKYLWVDGFCILGRDDVDKAYQIGHMDAIYRGATVTLIAAAGDSADYGLPGVRPGSRTKLITQHTCVINNTTIAVADLRTRPELPHSTWSTRGWTLQEDILSRRCVYFTDHQIFYECALSHFCESTILESDDPSMSVLTTDYLGRKPQGSDWLWQYAQYVDDYTPRDLSFEDDILDAFRGIMNELDHLAGGFHFGLPQQRFEKTLAWYSGWYNGGDPSRRRKKFPSWSWAGWKRIKPNAHPSHYRRSIYSAFWIFDYHRSIQWYTPNTSMPPDHVPSSPSDTKVGVQALNPQRLTSVFNATGGGSTEKWTNPLEIPEPKPPLSHFLCFFTTLKCLELVSVHENLQDHPAECYEIFDRGINLTLGEVWIHRDIIKQHGMFLDFIVVAQEGDPARNFIIMAIACENGYAERVELAHNRVRAKDWLATGPERRIINLA